MPTADRKSRWTLVLMGGDSNVARPQCLTSKPTKCETFDAGSEIASTSSSNCRSVPVSRVLCCLMCSSQEVTKKSSTNRCGTSPSRHSPHCLCPCPQAGQAYVLHCPKEVRLVLRSNAVTTRDDHRATLRVHLDREGRRRPVHNRAPVHAVGINQRPAARCRRSDDQGRGRNEQAWPKADCPCKGSSPAMRRTPGCRTGPSGISTKHDREPMPGERAGARR